MCLKEHLNLNSFQVGCTLEHRQLEFRLLESFGEGSWCFRFADFLCRQWCMMKVLDISVL